MKRKKRLFSLCLSILLICTFCTQVFAVSGDTGRAVYREKIGYEYHAAIMVHPNDSYTNPVVYIDSDDGGIVTSCSWSAFLDGNEFVGTFQPAGISDTERTLATLTAGSLLGENIQYTSRRQIEYDSSCFGNSKLYPEDVKKMRCDGVVEYCYEYNGVRVYGKKPSDSESSTYWNIAKPTSESYSRHGAITISPLLQAQNFMVEVP